MSTRTKKPVESDRSMDQKRDDRSRVFFFPKRNPPVSVRATSREEAERLLETPNHTEND